MVRLLGNLVIYLIKMIRMKVIILLAAVLLEVVRIAAQDVIDNCQLFSAVDSQNYWYVYVALGCCDLLAFFVVLRDSAQHCRACTSNFGCGFCVSTLECSTGDPIGPSNGLPCPEWYFDQGSCPGTIVFCDCADEIL